MFLLIDKPKGITSHDVVDVVRGITSERKVGHAGTLDPNATGLLIIAVGRESTKKLGPLAKDTTKTYMAEIMLGEERETDDVEGRVRKTELTPMCDFTDVDLISVLKLVEGEQLQTPPKYSAIKKGGRKAYEIARAGKEMILEPRKIAVYSIELLDHSFPKLHIKCEVSSGTYIRALARDIGRELECGAYLNELRRNKIGKFDVKDAIKLNDLKDDNWKDHVLGL